MINFKKNDAPLSGEIIGLNLNQQISIEVVKKIINFVDENLVVLIREQYIDDKFLTTNKFHKKYKLRMKFRKSFEYIYENSR